MAVRAGDKNPSIAPSFRPPCPSIAISKAVCYVNAYSLSHSWLTDSNLQGQAPTIWPMLIGDFLPFIAQITV